MTKKIICLFTALIIVFCLTACQNEQIATEGHEQEAVSYEKPVHGGTLNLCMYEVDTLNPLTTKNESNIDYLRLMFDGLFTVNQDFSVENNLCNSYTLSSDGLSYSFDIRTDAFFHNGTRLTAADVDKSFKLIIDAQGPLASRFGTVKSTNASGTKWNVTLSSPVINFTALLDFPVLPKEDTSLPSGGADINYSPNGTGIYRLSDYKMSKELSLIANESHFSGKKTYIPEIKISIVKDRETSVSMLENLACDMLPESVVNLNEYTPKRALKTAYYPTNKLTFIGLNNQKPILISSSVRRAIAMCVNKNAIASEVQSNLATVADIPINPNAFNYSSAFENVVYDTEKARLQLESDGFSDTDSDGVLDKMIYGEEHPLALDILVNSENALRIKIANYIKAELLKAGFFVTVTNVSFEEYKERISSKNYDIFIGSLKLSNNGDLGFMLESDRNVYGISNEKIDLCLSQLGVITNSAALSGVYRDLCSILSEEMPIIGLYFENGSLLLDNKIGGKISPSNANIFTNIHEWFIKKSSK